MLYTSQADFNSTDAPGLFHSKRLSHLFVIAFLTGMLGACSSTKAPAPIETRNPQSATPGARVEVPRRAEVPAAGVTPPAAPAQPAAKPAESKPATGQGGAETGSVKQGSTEVRPLGPATPSGTGTPPQAVPPVVVAPPVKTGPKPVKKPYSETLLAELKAADTPLLGPAPPAPQTAPPVTPSPSAPPTPPATAPASAPTPVPSPASAGFSWPSSGKVLAPFSEPKQMGLAIEGKLGDAVGAAGDGKVIYSGPGPRGYGNLIIVKHDGDLLTVYGHNKTLLVKEGQSVKKGQKIAEIGDTGNGRPQLHFEIRRQGKPVDPKQFLPAR